MNEPITVLVGGTRLDLLELEDLEHDILAALASEHEPLVVASSNLDHVFRFGHGAVLADPVARAGSARWLVTADGVPIVRAARFLTGRSWPQLAGSDLLPRILELAEQATATVGFLGGAAERHPRLLRALTEQFPGLVVGGHWHPDRQDLEDPSRARHLAREVADAGVDLLVVGLGKPRQELWLADHFLATGAKVALAFGASADFLAGAVPRAPASWRRAGFEWLYRLIREPRRLWRRYLLQGPVALWRVLRWSAPGS